MKLLDSRLNALTNFHYTPRPPTDELKITSNIPSLMVEEVAPTVASTADRLAPEELHAVCCCMVDSMNSVFFVLSIFLLSLDFLFLHFS